MPKGTAAGSVHRLAALLACAVLLASAPTEAGMLTPRFREHFDVSQIRYGDLGVEQAYFGATNTVNLWWEEPGRWALGLAFMPVLTSGYDAIDGRSPRVDGNVRLWNFGVEGKWHFRERRYFWPFARAGVFGSRLEIDPVFGGDRWGGSYFFALGGEVPVWDRRIGIALDAGVRHSILERDTQVLSFTPSLAVAFYFVSDWLAGARR